eukprot:4441184-Alexandrium_andersonii.AAC.1
MGLIADRAHAAYFVGWKSELAARAAESQVFSPSALLDTLPATRGAVQLAKEALVTKSPALA